MVKVDGGDVYQILRCDGEGEWDDCEVQAYRDNKPTGGKSRMSVRNLRAAEQRLLAAGGAASRGETAPAREASPPAREAAPPAPKPPAPTGPVAGVDGKWKVGDRLEVNHRAFWYPAQIIEMKGKQYKVHFDGYPSSDDQWVDASRMRPVGGHQISAACTWDAPGPAVTSKTSFSETLAKRKIYDQYSWKANATLSAPSKVGVTFLSFQKGAPYRNTVANVPGQGAQRKHAGAPVGATIYTFKSRHMVCEQYRDGVTRRIVDGTHACFLDRDGAWTCPSETDTKIIQLDQ